MVPTDAASLQAALQGHADPVAQWILGNADADAVVSSDAASLVEGVGLALDCDPALRETYVVLSNPLAPKAVVAHCADVPTDASRVLTIFEPQPELGDLDADHVRMAAWDPAAERYRRYQFAPHPDGGLGVVSEPEFCASCHTFGEHAWTPIMNEMTNPWTRWHTEPDFTSLLFDESVADPYRGPTWDWATQTLASASRFEPIIRASAARVTEATIQRRTEPARPDLVEALVRPVFCDDTYNFASESHDSGELDMNVALDPMIRRAMGFADPDALGPWAVRDSLKLPAPGDEASAIRFLAVRSTLTVEAEAALLSRNVLEPMDVLRVRALDWMRPVGSPLRCALYEDALPRWQPATDATATDAARALYEHVMAPVAARLDDDDTVLAIGEASSIAELDAAEVLTLAQWDGAIASHLEGLETDAGRSRLRAEVQARACTAWAVDPTVPKIPGFEPGRCP